MFLFWLDYKGQALFLRLGGSLNAGQIKLSANTKYRYIVHLGSIQSTHPGEQSKELF